MATARRTKERKERQRVSARKRAEEHKSGFSSKCYRIPDGVKSYSIKKEGVHRMDIIPYTVPEGVNNPFAEPGELHFERTYYTHRDIGPDGDMYPCLKKTFGTACPICDHRASMLRDPDADEELVKSLAPKERQLWNVFDPDDAEKGVQLWDCSFHLFGKQLDARVNNSDEDDGYEFFADPDDGLTLKVGFKEKTFGGNTFCETETIDFKSRKAPLPDELLEKAMILDSLLIKYDYDSLKQIFLQTRHEDDKDEIREPVDKKKVRGKPKEEEVEEEIENEDDEDFEEEQPPKGKSRPADTKEKKESVSSVGKKSTPPKKDSPDTAPNASPSRKRRPVSEEAKSMPKASDFGLEVNMVVDHPEWGQDCSIVSISGDETAVYILDTNNKKHSVSPKDLTIVEFEDDVEEEEEPPKKAKSSKKAKPEPEETEEENEEEWDSDWEED